MNRIEKLFSEKEKNTMLDLIVKLKNAIVQAGAQNKNLNLALQHVHEAIYAYNWNLPSFLEEPFGIEKRDIRLLGFPIFLRTFQQDSIIRDARNLYSSDFFLDFFVAQDLRKEIDNFIQENPEDSDVIGYKYNLKHFAELPASKVFGNIYDKVTPGFGSNAITHLEKIIFKVRDKKPEIFVLEAGTSTTIQDTLENCTN